MWEMKVQMAQINLIATWEVQKKPKKTGQYIWIGTINI